MENRASIWNKRKIYIGLKFDASGDTGLLSTSTHHPAGMASGKIYDGAGAE
jgi:hypothetical protein